MVPGGKAGPHPFGPEQVGVLHAERAEHVLAQVPAERDPGAVLDDLAERRESVIGVGPLGARLGVDAQAVPVVLGQRGHRLARRHVPAQLRPQQVGGLRTARTPAVWVSRCRSVAGPNPGLAGISRKARR